MRERFVVVVFNQSCSTVVFELCARLATEIGPTLLHTGTDFSNEKRPGLEVLTAPSYDNSSYRSRLWTWSMYTSDALRVASTLRGCPAVMVSSNPPCGPLLGYTLRRLRGWPYLVRILDVYPDALVQAGLVSERHAVPLVWRRLNRIALAHARHVVTLGPVMTERVQRYLPDGPQVQCIPDWVDPSQIRPRDKNENWFAAEHGQRGKLTFLYSGNLGITHDLTALFEVAEALQYDQQIGFLFIGGGARRSELEAVAKRLRNVLLLPNQPEKNLPFSMTTGDVAVVALGKGSEGISMPSKAYYMMAAGCAILGISHGDNDLKRIIERYECGINVDPADIDELRAAVGKFRDDPDFLARCRKNARRAAEEVFSSEACTTEYLKLLIGMRKEARAA